MPKKHKYFLKITDVVIEVLFSSNINCPLKKVLIDNYKDYFVKECLNPDFFIEVRKNYIFRALRVKNRAYISFYNKAKTNKVITSMSLNTLQSHLFFKTVFYNFLFKKRLLFIHSSACLVNGKALIFTGKNNTGKSTIVKMLKNKFMPLCDDMAMIKKNAEGKLLLHQVPYPEKNQYKKSNTCYPVAGFYFLKQAKKFKVKKIEFLKKQEYFNYIYEQISINANRNKIIKLIFSLREKIFELYFSKNDTLLLEKYFKTNIK